MNSFEKYRLQFPITKNLIYMNHAATSPLSLHVIEALERHIRERSEIVGDNWENIFGEVDKLRMLLGKMIGSNADRIAFVPNTSTGLNIIASGLKWKEGDEILIPEREFPANVHPFLNLQKNGVKVKFLPTPNGGLEKETLLAAIAPQTRLLSISFVEFLSGYKHDLREIGQICKEHDIIFIVDGIQGVGVVPLDVRECHIDAMACGGHKWLMFPQGFGFLYITKTLQNKISQSHKGWIGLENPEDFSDYDQELSKEARRYETGGFSTLGLVGAIAAMELFLEIGVDNIYNRLCELTSRLISGLEDNGFNIFTNKDLERRSGIVTFYPENKQDSEKMFEFLRKNHIRLSFREGMIRVSPHFYNNEEETDKLILLCREFTAKNM